MEMGVSEFDVILTHQQKADARLTATFYMKGVKNEIKTREAGFVVNDPVLCVTIISPGERYPLWDTIASEDHKKRFPRQYKAFLESQEVPETGTPLEEWPMLDRILVDTYKSLNIKTVEQMADLSESVIGKVGIGARDLQKKAKAWLEAAAGSADVQRHAVENDELRAEVKELQKKVAELMSENKTLSKNLKRSE